MQTPNSLKFFKYQGAGNDFVLVDNRDLSFKHQGQTPLLRKICDRRMGIGGDGIMFLEPKEGFDFEMIYYNSDGNLSSMCGNGGRCIVAFAKHLGIIDSTTKFIAYDGPHYAEISKTGDWVSLHMKNVDTIDRDSEDYVLNTGSPHYVTFVSELQSHDVPRVGRAIRNGEKYVKEGINVNFVEKMEDHCFVRTYERGVEDETHACGTGVTAVALVMAHQTGLTGDHCYNFRVVGGKLSVKLNFDGLVYSNIFLEGPAKYVFEGEVNLDKLLM